MTIQEFCEHMRHLARIYGYNVYELVEKYYLYVRRTGKRSLVGFEIHELQKGEL